MIKENDKKRILKEEEKITVEARSSEVDYQNKESVNEYIPLTNEKEQGIIQPCSYRVICAIRLNKSELLRRYGQRGDCI